MKNFNERHHAFTLIEILVSLAVIGLLASLLLPAVQSARESARRIACTNNISQVGKAVQSYAASSGYFPPGVIRWTGWSPDKRDDAYVQVEFSLFVRILPQLEQHALFDSFNFYNSITEPMNARYEPRKQLVEENANMTARSSKLQILLCPSDRSAEPTLSAGTNLRVNEGSWPSHRIDESIRFSGPAGPVYVSTFSGFSSRKSTTVASVTDGMSNTVLVGEKLRGNEHRSDDSPPFNFDPRRHYSKPGVSLYGDDPVANDDVIRICNDPATRYNGFNPNAGLVWVIGGIRNASYNHVAAPNPPFADCVTGPGIEPTGIASARSQHPGGVNVGLADGSVRFVRNGVDLNVWRAIGTKAGGEVLNTTDY